MEVKSSNEEMTSLVMVSELSSTLILYFCPFITKTMWHSQEISYELCWSSSLPEIMQWLVDFGATSLLFTGNSLSKQQW